MVKSLDIAWLGGIVEGEGYITSHRGSPQIKVDMTDRDTVEKIASLLGVRIGKWTPRYPNAKQVWSCSVHGYRAIGWMQTLYLFLGERRRAAVRESIRKWVAAPGPARKVRGKDGKALPSLCHPDRPIHARRQCRQCYGRAYMLTWRSKRRAA